MSDTTPTTSPDQAEISYPVDHDIGKLLADVRQDVLSCVPGHDRKVFAFILLDGLEKITQRDSSVTDIIDDLIRNVRLAQEDR